MTPIFWTDEKIEELKRHWTVGLSAGAIADRMGATRNAILGKAHRLDLVSRQPQADPEEQARKRQEKLDRAASRLGRIYRLKFIRQMLALPGVEICTAAPTEPRDPLKFRFTGGEGVVMPMLQKCVRHVECEPAPVPA